MQGFGHYPHKCNRDQAEPSGSSECPVEVKEVNQKTGRQRADDDADIRHHLEGGYDYAAALATDDIADRGRRGRAQVGRPDALIAIDSRNSTVPATAVVPQPFTAISAAVSVTMPMVVPIVP